jgi:hypothetical protein
MTVMYRHSEIDSLVNRLFTLNGRVKHAKPSRYATFLVVLQSAPCGFAAQGTSIDLQHNVLCAYTPAVKT